MTYEATRDFPGAEPRLRAELQRFERKIAAALATEQREAVRVFTPRRVKGARHTAAHWEAVLAGFNQNAAILLPRSERSRAGHAVRVGQVGGAGAVTVVAQPGDTVNAASSVAIGVATGYQEFFDDGEGGWWGPA